MFLPTVSLQSFFFFFSFFSSSSLQHVQFLHLGVSPAESRHTAAHSLLNKPEASQSQERLSCTQEKTSGAHTLRVSCSMVCVHPLAFCRTNLGTLTHTHTHTHTHIYTWRQTYARSTHTSEEDAGGSVWVIEHVNGNVESSSYKQTSVETRGDRKWRLEEMWCSTDREMVKLNCRERRDRKRKRERIRDVFAWLLSCQPEVVTLSKCEWETSDGLRRSLQLAADVRCRLG